MSTPFRGVISVWSLQRIPSGGPGEGGCTHHNGLYREALPEPFPGFKYIMKGYMGFICRSMWKGRKSSKGQCLPAQFFCRIYNAPPPRFANVPWTELFKVDIRKGNLIDWILCPLGNTSRQSYAYHFRARLRDALRANRTCPGGGGTAIYGLYRYVPLWRVWFSSSLL